MQPLHLPLRAFDSDAVWLEAVTDQERAFAEAYDSALYRFYDVNGVFLYVGVSRNLPDRWNWHRCRTQWYAHARYVALSFYPRRDDAFRAEAAAIRTRHPEFNVIRCKTRSKYRPADDPAWVPPQPRRADGGCSGSRPA